MRVRMKPNTSATIRAIANPVVAIVPVIFFVAMWARGFQYCALQKNPSKIPTAAPAESTTKPFLGFNA